MKTLVIIPSLQHKYTFSAPLAWLFSHHVGYVDGIYSFALTEAIVKQYHHFIVELNWFLELYEFRLIAKFIKKHNPQATILFGGLYSQLKYKEIFEDSPVDYFIRGDTELPIQQFIEGVEPRSIPNMVGRDFENPQTYVFQQADYQNLEFNLDWFPEYLRRWEEFPEPGADVDADFSQLPLYPRYWEKPGTKKPLSLRWRVPPKGGRYHLPMLITARGACPLSHPGCEYCMGSKHDHINDIYKRPALIMDNETCIKLLKKIEKRFKYVSLLINSGYTYDFSKEHFDLEATVEVDGRSNFEDVAKILPAFRKANFHAALYNDGLVGKELRTDLARYSDLEDANHKVYFFAFPEDAAASEIPPDRRLYSELVLPSWTHWDFYNNKKNALSRSRSWYFSTGQVNLYPLPRQIMMRITRFFLVRILFVLNRLKLIDLKKKSIL
ncbi:MAG: hypothetical protein JXA21_19130 [Anaerolineae bacterium]|nr:hypothetical protein [Anaerolineae bacterium]